MPFRVPALELAALTVLAIAPAAVAGAAEPVRRPAAVVSELTACRSEADPARRLACYDGAVAKLAAATESREVVVVDREEIKQTRRSLFGFSLPRIALFGRGDAKEDAAIAREDVSEIDTVIRSAQSLGYGKYQLVLAEGGTWRSTEAWNGKLPAAGAKIHVKRGALGSYMMTVEKGRAVRAMRVG